MNLTAAQNNALATVLAENDVGAWDGHRIRAMIALLQQWLPIILPYILPLVAVQEDTVAASDADAEKLSAVDWQALIKLILQLLAILFPPTPAPEPSPGPVA